ncbi:hypothetical protein [Nonomuraea sp. NPDC050783]|uniref:hypothetical protein n=1 Tax=Nonomuraea sp. NPDC050783 TaxID=3154634 RepID=UPI0034673ADF
MGIRSSIVVLSLLALTATSVADAAARPAPAAAAEAATVTTMAAAAAGCDGVAVGPEEVVVSAATRDRLGLKGWPDSAISAERTSDGRLLFHAPDAFGGPAGGPAQRNVVTAGDLEDPVSGGIVKAAPVRNAPDGYAWIGGGPIWKAPDGTVLKVLHLEKYNAAGNLFYAELHLGRHDPATGVTTYLGPVARPDNDLRTAFGLNQIADMGMSSLTRRGDHLYVYFPDFTVDSRGRPASTALSVARAPVAEVLAAAAAGKATTWNKYHDGGWDSPAYGDAATGAGPSTDLQPGLSMAWAPHVARLASGGVLMAAAVSTREIVISTSPDGVRDWSARVPLFREAEDRHVAYVSVVGTGADPATVGRSFYVYYTQWLSPNPDWTRAQLVRRHVRCTATLAAEAVPLIRHLNAGHHRVTTSLLAEAGTYPQFGGIWGLLSARRPGTRPLYECRAGAHDFFVSKDAACDAPGNAIVQTLGWIHTARPAAPSTPLYRCDQPGKGHHFVSITADCEGDGTPEGLLGYALSTTRTPFVRYYNGWEHRETTDSVTSSYKREKQTWYLENAERPGTIPLYGCSYAVPRGINHFVSVTADCEGLTRVRKEGYLHTQPPSSDYRPLYRCFWPANHDHFLSTEADCEGVQGGAREGRLGYVATSPGFTDDAAAASPAGRG